jgi:hypothetical protein
MKMSEARYLLVALMVVVGALALPAQLHTVVVKGKWGLINEEGEVVVNPIFDKLERMGTTAWVCRQDSNYGFVHEQQGMLLQPEWHSGRRIGNLACFRFDRGSQSAFVIYNPFDSLYHTYEVDSLGSSLPRSMIVFHRAGKSGLLQLNLGEVLPAEYDEIRYTTQFISARRDHKLEIFNSRLRLLATTAAEAIQELTPALLAFRVKGHWGVIDTNGRELLPPRFTAVQTGVMNTLKVEQEGRLGIYSFGGAELLTLRFLQIDQLNNGWAVATDESSVALYSSSGKRLCEMRDYVEYRLLTMTCLKVTSDRMKSGVIDSTGKLVVPCIYEDVREAGGVYLAGSTAKGWLLLGADGKALSSILVDGVGVFANNAAIFTRAGKEGLIRMDGKVLLPAEYNNVQRVGTVVRAKKGETWSTFYFTDEGEPTDAPQIILDRDYVTKEQASAANGPAQKGPRARPKGWYQNSLGKWGLTDTAGTRVAIQPQFDQIYTLNARLTLVEKNLGNDVRYGVVDQLQARIIHPVKFREVRWTQMRDETLPMLTPEGFWVLMNGKGKLKSLGQVTYLGAWTPEKTMVACVGGKLTFHQKRTVETVKERDWKTAETADRQTRFGQIEGGKWGIMDIQGNWVMQPQFDFLGEHRDGVMVYRKGAQYGLLNDQGAPLTDALYTGVEYLRLVDSSMICMQMGGRKMGIIDTLGHWVVAPEWDEALDFKEGYAPVRKGATWNYVDAQGHLLLEQPVSLAYPFSEGWARVKYAQGWNFVNAQGERLSRESFLRVSDFHDGKAAVVVRGVACYVDTQGKVSGVFRETTDYRKGRAIVRDAQGCTVINLAGDALFRRRFKSLRWMNDSLLVAVDGKRRGVITLQGEWIVKGEYANFSDGGEGLILAQQHQRFFWLDQRGKKVFQDQWMNATPFQNSIASVCTPNGWGTIDRSGKIVTQPTKAKALAANPRHTSPYWAKMTGKWCLYSAQGNPLDGVSLMEEPHFAGGYAPAVSVPLWALYSPSGKELIPPMFERYEIDGKLLRAYVGGTWSYARRDGSWVWR